MKKLIIALIAFIGLMEADTAQAEGKRIVTVTAVHSGGTWAKYPAVNITSGQYVRVLSCFKTETEHAKLICTIGVNEFDLIHSSGSVQSGSIGPNDGNGEIVVAGPATLEFSMGSDGQGMLMTYEILPSLPE